MDGVHSQRLVLYYRRRSHCSSRGSPSGTLEHVLRHQSGNCLVASTELKLEVSSKFEARQASTPPRPGQPDPKRWAATLFMLRVSVVPRIESLCQLCMQCEEAGLVTTCN